MKKNDPEEKELTQREFDKLLEDLELFNTDFFTALAGTERFEVISTETELGQPLTREQYSLIKAECNKVGITIIYKINMINGNSVFMNSNNGKIGILDGGIH